MIPRRTFVAAMAGTVAIPWYRLPADDTRVAQLTDGTLHSASARVLAEAIRRKRVSSLEVVDACLRRIDEINPKLNALVESASGGWKPPPL